MRYLAAVANIAG